MTVKITRPSIDIRGTLDELNKPSGIAGNAMLAAETPQEQFNLIGAGRKNLIINGAMQVSQRGDIDSSSAAAHLTYQIDRWRTVNNVAATIQRKVEQTLPTGERVNTLNITMSATGYAALQQRVEDYIYLRGKTVILSMWVKSNVRAGMSIYDGLSQPFAVPHSGNGEWEYITVAHSCPTNISDMRAELWTTYPVSADAYIEIANVQLEVGSIATDFEHRSYGEELALCQRYYQQFDYTGTYHHIGLGQAGGPFLCYMDFPFLNEMRTPPTISHNGVGNFRLNSFSTGQDEVCNNIIYDFITKYSARIRFYKATGDFTTNQNAYINTESDNNASFYIDAEL